MQIRLYVYTTSTLVNPKKQTIGIRRKANAESKIAAILQTKSLVGGKKVLPLI